MALRMGNPQRMVRRKKVEVGLQWQEWVLVSRGFAWGLSYGLRWSGSQCISGMTLAGESLTG